MEKLCLPYRVVAGMIGFGEVEATVLRAVLDPEAIPSENASKDIIETLTVLAGFPIEKKARAYVGGRMGRPEKAKERTMTPRVHALFPTGQLGGPRRDIVEASKKSLSSLELVDRVCLACDKWEARLKFRNFSGEDVVLYHALCCAKTV